MNQELYDVIVVGAADATPAGEARLAATLARGQGLPVAAVARSVAEKNLRMGERMPREAAASLVQQLKASGALTSVRRASAPAPGQAPMPAAAHGFTAAGSPGTMQGLGPLNLPMPGGRPAALTLAPLGTPAATAPRTVNPGDFRAPSPGTNANANPGSGPKSSASLRPLTAANVVAPELALAEPSSSISGFAMPVAAADPFSVPEQGESPLELALAPSDTASASPDRTQGFKHSYTLDGASALNTSKIEATASSSGLDVHDEAGEVNRERCPTHGLFFDRRKSTGCRKCFEDKRSGFPASNRSASKRRSDGLTSSPAKRAFLGLALALFLGFAPAAYYALFPGAGEVDRLRAEQKLLSEMTGTEENLRRFEQLEEQVASGHSKAARNTLIMWVAISGVVMAAWYKTTS
jgi:hypothetical protein